jgi:hypothetical protein
MSETSERFGGELFCSHYQRFEFLNHTGRTAPRVSTFPTVSLAAPTRRTRQRQASPCRAITSRDRILVAASCHPRSQAVDRERPPYVSPFTPWPYTRHFRTEQAADFPYKRRRAANRSSWPVSSSATLTAAAFKRSPPRLTKLQELAQGATSI